MTDIKGIKSALISVFDKEGLEPIVKVLHEGGVALYSTGGTQKFIEDLGIPVVAVESLTDYPSIFGGRVKTLHPKVFGGILARRDLDSDKEQLASYAIPEIDLVIVDLYPFEETVAQGGTNQEIIEKIDIGGISLIRAAAKNHNDVVIVASKQQYAPLMELLQVGVRSSLEQRREFAKQAFAVSSGYDTAIFNYFKGDDAGDFRYACNGATVMRYGENPHQQGVFYGQLNSLFNQLHGKELSYNNLLDVEAAVQLIDEFEETSFAILKHNNACGMASRNKLAEAWKEALAGDPISAFGGVLITNKTIDLATAEEMDQLFFELVIAPAYELDALEVLKRKKNRIILERKSKVRSKQQFRSMLGGVLLQDRDCKTEGVDDLSVATSLTPDAVQIEDLLFANKLVKHSKSNAIVLAKNKQLIASGVGETSRVDALKHAIEKAKHFNLDLKGAVLASDAFFPFADCVALAKAEGVSAVIQPGGSVRDQESIDFCNEHGMSMVMTGVRHFKH